MNVFKIYMILSNKNTRYYQKCEVVHYYDESSYNTTLSCMHGHCRLPGAIRPGQDSSTQKREKPPQWQIETGIMIVSKNFKNSRKGGTSHSDAILVLCSLVIHSLQLYPGGN